MIEDGYTFGVGTPSLSLLPARNYYYKVEKEQHKIIIPNSGVYSEHVEEEAKDLFSFSNEFKIYDEESKTFNFMDIVRVCFATKQYPDLPQNYLFVPQFMQMKDNNIVIVGQVVQMLSKEQYEEDTAMVGVDANE